MPPTHLHGKIALITGASRGIGAASAQLLAAHGAHVVLLARDEAALQAQLELIRAAGGLAQAHRVDVADGRRLSGVVEAVLDRLGGIDLLVNNAGVIEPIAPLHESDPQAWCAALDINLKGVYHALRAVLPAMLAARAGCIINLSSGAATRALEGWSQYCAAKAGVAALTRSVHEEYAAAGIRVYGLSPGTVATDMQRRIRASGINPVSRLDPAQHITAQRVAQAILWLSTAAASPWAGGEVSLRDPQVRAAIDPDWE